MVSVSWRSVINKVDRELILPVFESKVYILPTAFVNSFFFGFCFVRATMSLLFSLRPDFITLYFNEPDSAGHRYGPDSTPVTTSILVLLHSYFKIFIDSYV